MNCRVLSVVSHVLCQSCEPCGHLADVQFARAVADAGPRRHTNPLAPEYPMPSSHKDAVPAHPVAAVPSQTVEGHAFERRRHPDWQFSRGNHPAGTQNTDIERSTPATMHQRVRTPHEYKSALSL